MFNPGIIRGGEKSNVVAQHCELDLEIQGAMGVFDTGSGIGNHISCPAREHCLLHNA